MGTHGTVKNAVNYGRNDNEVRCCVENINTVVDIKKTTTDTRSKWTISIWHAILIRVGTSYARPARIIVLLYKNLCGT